jgi:cobalt-zinc-cadmium efflux system outer membrane protein
VGEHCHGATTTAAALVLAGAAAACVPALPKKRSWISDELTRRVGDGLRAEGADRDVRLPPSIALDKVLTADGAVAVALWNNAAFQADLTQLGFARADLADAGALQNPILSLLFPIGTKQLELTVRLGLGVLLHRPSRVAAATHDASRVAEELVQHGLDLARDVRLAYVDAVLADDLEVLARDAQAIWAELLLIAEGRLLEGDASAREIESARADARAAQSDADAASSGAALARNRLANLLGLSPTTTLQLDPEPAMAVTGDLARWTQIAMAARPDLRAAELAIEAAGERAGLERRRIFDLIAILDVNGTGWEVGPGIELPIPLLDQRQGGRIRAAAELERASWRYVAKQREIEREVIDAHVRLGRATSALAIWTNEVVPGREESLRLARLGYERGEESHLVVLETARDLVDARRKRAELAAERRRAAVELERAAGGRAP